MDLFHPNQLSVIQTLVINSIDFSSEGVIHKMAGAAISYSGSIIGHSSSSSRYIKRYKKCSSAAASH